MEGCLLLGLFVEGIGPIPLLLQPDQARLLVERSCQAPFGCSVDTVVNSSI